MLSALTLQTLGSARRMNGDYFPSGLQYWSYMQCVPWERNLILISSLEREIPYHTVKTTTRMSFKLMSAQRLAIKTSQKPWSNSIANRAGWSRIGADAKCHLLTGYNCLANHLYHIGLGYFLIHQREEMDKQRLLRHIGFIFNILKPKVLGGKRSNG